MIETRRSSCPINRGVELLGDRWSLVILRDVAFQDHRTFRDLLTGSQEGIAPSVLSRRLKEMVTTGLLTKEDAPRGHQGRYSLTEHGIQLVPLLFELARVGSLLDPTTFSTRPETAALGDDPGKVQALMADLRAQHLGARHG